MVRDRNLHAVLEDREFLIAEIRYFTVSGIQRERMLHSLQNKKKKKEKWPHPGEGRREERGRESKLRSMTEHSTSFTQLRIESQGAVTHQSTYDQ